MYGELINDFLFTPIEVETFGSWGRQGHSLVKEIGQKSCDITGDKKSSFYLGVSKNFHGTAVGSSNLEEVFYI